MMRRMNKQTRTLPVQLTRAEEVDGVGVIEAVVLTYGTVDSYDTTFARGVFDASMDAEMPVFVWAHDWSEPIGRWTEYRDEIDRLVLVGQLDLHPDVPRARQAWAQIQSGTLRHFSVGFRPQDTSMVDIDGREVLQFDRGILDETSVVIVGAVPGTKVTAVRTPGATDVQYAEGGEDVTLDMEHFARLLQDVEAGVLTAQGAVDRATAVLEPDTDTDSEGELEPLDDDDLLALAVLADEGDEDAAAELEEVLSGTLDTDDYEWWSEAVDAYLDNAPVPDDDEGELAPGESDTGAVAEGEPDESAEDDDEDAEADAEVDDEIAAALALLDELD